MSIFDLIAKEPLSTKYTNMTTFSEGLNPFNKKKLSAKEIEYLRKSHPEIYTKYEELENEAMELSKIELANVDEKTKKRFGYRMARLYQNSFDLLALIEAKDVVIFLLFGPILYIIYAIWRHSRKNGASTDISNMKKKINKEIKKLRIKKANYNKRKEYVEAKKLDNLIKEFSSIEFGESLSFGDNFKAFWEAEDDDIPEGDLENEDEPSEEIEEPNFDDSDEYVDESYGEEESGEEPEIKNPLDDVADSEKSLVRDLRENMATFYYNRQADLEKIMASNISTTDNGEEIEKIIDKYKTTLTLFKDHLRDGFYEGSVSSKTMTFIEYKAVFNQLNASLNEYFSMLADKEEE